jgi:hypothetical protein
MKQLFRLVIASTLLLFLGSCSKDDDNSMTTQASNTLKSGTWKVSLFVDSGVDETTDFSSFNFSFANAGVVTATNNAFTATGTWSTGTDDSTPKLNLAFTTPALFIDLTEDWEILTVTNTTVSLHHQSGGGGSMDMLTFQKN